MTKNGLIKYLNIFGIIPGSLPISIGSLGDIKLVILYIYFKQAATKGMVNKNLKGITMSNTVAMS